MEAAQALGRGARLTFVVEAIREWAGSRSREFWIVAGISVLAAGLRFATLGLQSYHHDEIVTVNRILPLGFGDAMDAVRESESAPPLYYALAWAWTQLTGTAEYGLRSLSALAGVATVPVAYLLGAELRSRRTGIAAAALVAVNPMLVWYSQEGRAYALFALLCAASTLYFVRALSRGRGGDLTIWGIVSGLALATHYFAVFPVAIEAFWLLMRRGRQAARGLSIVAVAALVLAPLAIHQRSAGHAEWIADHALGHRLWETVATLLTGETGDLIARTNEFLPALAPFLLVSAALLLILVRGAAADRRAAGIPLALAAATVAIPVALAVVTPGNDYVLARNLMPALVPLLVAVAVGVTLRDARRSGAVLGAALFAYSLGFCLWATLSPSLQRPDWEAVAAKLGEPAQPRALVSWTLGEASLRYYLDSVSFQTVQSEGFSWYVHEVDFISDGPAPAVPPGMLPPGFRQVSYEQVGRLDLRRYALPGPDLAPVRLRDLRSADTNFRSNGVLIDGIAPG